MFREKKRKKRRQARRREKLTSTEFIRIIHMSHNAERQTDNKFPNCIPKEPFEEAKRAHERDRNWRRHFITAEAQRKIDSHQTFKVAWSPEQTHSALLLIMKALFRVPGDVIRWPRKPHKSFFFTARLGSVSVSVFSVVGDDDCPRVSKQNVRRNVFYLKQNWKVIAPCTTSRVASAIFYRTSSLINHSNKYFSGRLSSSPVFFVFGFSPSHFSHLKWM